MMYKRWKADSHNAPAVRLRSGDDDDRNDDDDRDMNGKWAKHKHASTHKHGPHIILIIDRIATLDACKHTARSIEMEAGWLEYAKMSRKKKPKMLMDE